MLYDISPVLRPETPVWPGDTPLALHPSARLSAGDVCNLSSASLTLHLGSHVDAPYHTEPRGETIAELALEPFLGPCQVLRVPPLPLLEPHHVAHLDWAACRRLLLHTESVRDRSKFSDRYTALSPALARLLAERRLLLLGIDTPSVDPFGSEGLEAHHHLARGGVSILEGLLLDGVPEGTYELIALPLKLAGADGSPVRAVLRSLPR